MMFGEDGILQIYHTRFHLVDLRWHQHAGRVHGEQIIVIIQRFLAVLLYKLIFGSGMLFVFFLQTGFTVLVRHHDAGKFLLQLAHLGSEGLVVDHKLAAVHVHDELADDVHHVVGVKGLHP